MRIVFVVLLLFSSISCTTSKFENKNIPDNSHVTLLTLPAQSQITITYADSFVQSNIEWASPDSLRIAVERLYTSTQGFSNKKLFSLTLAVRLMRILYPLEAVDWNVPSYTGRNSYLDALTQIENGIYPQLMEDNTFLGAVIPAIILTKRVSVQEYAAGLEARLLTARTINPQSILPFYLLGLLYEQLNRLSDAENAYQIAWDRDQSCYPAGIGFARLSLRRNNIEKAFTTVQMLYDRYPKSIPIQLLLAEVYLETDMLEAAEELIYAIVKQYPDQRDALFLRIRLHVEKKEYLPATALLDGYAKKNKVDKDYLLLRMRVLREWSKNIVEAKKCLEQAELLYPDSADVVLACAEFCFERKETINGKDANDFIDMLLRQGPRNIVAIRLLVKQDIAEKRWAAAFERAQYLYTNSPSEEHIILYARACIGMGNWQEAVSIARSVYTAVEKPSNELTALYLETLYGAKNFAAIRRIIAWRLSDARSSLKSILLYYQALLEKNDEEKLALLRLSLLSDPRSHITLFALYEWYLRHKDYRKAFYYLQQVIALFPDNKTYLELAARLEYLLRISPGS